MRYYRRACVHAGVRAPCCSRHLWLGDTNTRTQANSIIHTYYIYICSSVHTCSVSYSNLSLIRFVQSGLDYGGAYTSAAVCSLPVRVHRGRTNTPDPITYICENVPSMCHSQAMASCVCPALDSVFSFVTRENTYDT